MNIDERIEALTQSLELLSSLPTDLEKQTATRFAETAAATAELQKQTAARFAETLRMINRRAHIAEVHDQRIERLEDTQ